MSCSNVSVWHQWRIFFFGFGVRYCNKETLQLIILHTRETRKIVTFWKLTIWNLFLIMYPEICAFAWKVNVQITNLNNWTFFIFTYKVFLSIFLKHHQVCMKFFYSKGENLNFNINFHERSHPFLSLRIFSRSIDPS